jgi:hypothetical protein
LWLGLLLLVPASALAQIETAIYEDWSGPVIRSDRWAALVPFVGRDAGLDVRTAVDAVAQKLKLELRTQTAAAPRAALHGIRLTRGDLPFTDGASVSLLDVEMTLSGDKLTKQCPPLNGGPVVDEPSATDALVLLKLFNDGTSTGAADQTGDHVGMIGTGHNTENPTQIHVYSNIFRCMDAACTEVEFVAVNYPPSKTHPDEFRLSSNLAMGATIRVRLTVDRASDQVYARLGTGADDFAMSYAGADDSLPPVVPFASIVVGAQTGDCYEGNRVASIAIGVGKVRTNAGAFVP